jgi:hypothetical protein
MIKVTVFKDYADTKAPHVSSVTSVLSKIKTGGERKGDLESLRGEDDKKKRDDKKKELPIVCFNGIFTERSKDGLVEGNGLMVLDFDSVKDMTALRDKIISKPYTFANFLSPSGTGYKTLIRIPKVNSDEEFKTVFRAAQAEFPELDESGKDISRACFFSYDPDIYINLSASEFKPDRKKAFKVKDWEKVNKALQKIEDSIEGEKHIIRMKISYLFGGWVAAGALAYEDAYTLLDRAVRKNTTNYPQAIKDIRDGLKDGQSKPLSLNQQNDTLEMKVGVGKVYYHMDEVMDKVQSFWETGYQRGYDTGWADLDKNYSILLGATTTIYGSPYSGKSQLWHEILVNLSVNYGLVHAIMSPETGEVHHIYSELISILAGKSFVGNTKMDRQEMEKHAEFIKRHFFVLDPLGQEFRMEDVLNQVEGLEREFEVKIHTITIDPLNYLEYGRPYVRDDIAQGKDLDMLAGDARKNGRHNCIITHTRDLPLRTEKDNNGTVVRSWYPPATPREIANGQMFFRKGFGMFCVYRPLDTEGLPLDDCRINETQVIVSKAKPKGIGEVGKVSLYYDKEKNRYYQQDGWYAKGFDTYTPPPLNETLTESPALNRIGKWQENVEDQCPF